MEVDLAGKVLWELPAEEVLCNRHLAQTVVGQGLGPRLAAGPGVFWAGFHLIRRKYDGNCGNHKSDRDFHDSDRDICETERNSQEMRQKSWQSQFRSRFPRFREQHSRH